jgi:lathosterol oxidase
VKTSASTAPHVHCNFGLYFNIWDRPMGTNQVLYEESFDRVVVSSQTDSAAISVSESP